MRLEPLIHIIALSRGVTLFFAGISAASLAAAYIAQYGFGLEPCILCLYQRIPYAVAVILGLIGWFSVPLRKVSIVLIIAAFIASAGVAAFHVGVEQGVFTLEEGCGGADIGTATTLEELQAQLLGRPHVPCDAPAFVFLGLSMAGWNVIFSLLWAWLAVYMARDGWRKWQ